MEELTKEELLDRFEKAFNTLNYRRTGKTLEDLRVSANGFCVYYDIPAEVRGDWLGYANVLADYEIYRATILGLWEYINEEGETRWTDEIHE